MTQVARVLWSDVGRAPSSAAGPLAGLPAGGRGRPPRSRGTASPSRCQSGDYLSQAYTPLRQIFPGAPGCLPGTHEEVVEAGGYYAAGDREKL